jgi:hypothetical protein
LSESKVVAWAVADDAGDAGGRAVEIYPHRCLQMLRGIKTDARVIVIEDEGGSVVLVTVAADSRVTRAEVAIGDIIGQDQFFLFDSNAAPGAMLAMSSNNDPFFT